MPGSDATTEAVGLRTHPLTAVVQGALFAVAASAGLVSSLLGGDGWGDLSPLLSLAVALGGGLAIGVLGGFVRWLTTRYVIDGTELRITSGLVTRSSRRIPYERIQSVDVAEPFVARLLGLAELRIEMAGGRDSRTSLRFLALDDVRELRRVLLARAHGGSATDDEVEHRTTLAEVPPARVVVGTLLSLDFLLAVTVAVALVVAAVWFRQVVVLLGGIVTVGTFIVQVVARRVVQQWGFTLSRGDRGLRIERGLLSRSSQAIPYARVQGVAVKEPYVWRRLGWQRLEVDVAGHAHRGGQDDDAEASSTLLPIADRALAAAVVAELVPATPADDLPRVAASPRSWVFAPVGWRHRWVGADDVAFVAREGWVERTTSIVPHAKTQSVELRQGPLQRLLGVATVEVHSPQGPVDADGRHLDAADARAVALAQLVRARRARG